MHPTCLKHMILKPFIIFHICRGYASGRFIRENMRHNYTVFQENSMKTQNHLLRKTSFLLLTLIFAIFLLTCSKKESPTQVDNQPLLSETPEMKALTENLISAFKAADVPTIAAHINSEYQETYADLSSQPAANLTALGAALENRKLIAVSALYAEYSITINNQEFRVAYAQCGDGNWQLVGF
jgi:hypothetical protein